MSKVFVIRALPGSGKTSVIEELWRSVPNHRHHYVHSSDLFPGLYTEDGKFHPELLSKSHAASLRGFIKSCQGCLDGDVIFSDNTNLSMYEYAPYVQVAMAYGHDVEIVTIECPPEVAAARNTHGVPLDKIMMMEVRMQEGASSMPRWWKHTVRKAWMP